MKAYLLFAAASVLILAGSCTKDHHLPPYGTHNGNTQKRVVRFELYTDQNFSTDQHNIQFNLQMRDSRNDIFDSALAVMKIKDIPDFNNRIVIEKSVPGNNPERLSVGFLYAIENVGISWHKEEFEVGDTLKVVSFDFR